MKDKIAFIAVGQAGGNIGQLFESMGYTVLYINTSREDLEFIQTVCIKIH
jgi:tubulin-like protein CetZ